MKYYYHITAKENIQSIINDGLRANEDGDIFVFQNATIYYETAIVSDGEVIEGIAKTTVADSICFNQLFITDKCVILKIDPRGIDNLEEDIVAEVPSYLHKQWIARQAVIKPEFFTLKSFTPKPLKMVVVTNKYSINEHRVAGDS